MKILLINGSPREKGCTWRALTEVADTLREEGIEAEIIHASMEREVIDSTIEKMKEADGLVLGSPVYYAALSGLMQDFCCAIFGKYRMRLKPGAAVVSCRRGGAATTFDALGHYLTISEMIQVGSNYWNQVHGNTPEEVEQDLEGLQTMRVLARNMAYVAKSLKAAGLPLPEAEKKIKTNFIR